MVGHYSETNAQSELHPSIETLVRLAPLLGEIFPDDVTIGVCDLDTLWGTIPGKTFSLGLAPGYQLVPGDGMYEAVHYGKPTKTYVPKEVFGVPILACTIPVHDKNGEVIGAIGAGASMQRYDHLSSIASTLSTGVQQISATIQELAASINILSNKTSDISVQSNEVLKTIKDIEQISDTVRNISDTSRFLGFNASIEAASAGEFGKGFSIIAHEVRKLADDSKNQTDIIYKTVSTVEQLVYRLSQSILTVSQETESQSAATEQLAAAIQDLSRSANELAQHAERIVSGEQEYE
ncbi:methyl-accepting chemotaxis protein [Alicyclobacillus dauci]|uniref:Methyl-accepting chemotaxis protein n=1 Tax=Alicyclobacillus dauci TaxID=1475485 RepID=A0ABY6Z4Z0_9BACL|nr:methyl-accepting chemotaxis protein [Alicyclobacillus dauci]WAH37085.1 methyl-accepting chemotaxis protein [Alicyclobacillus dauci]